MNFRFLVRKPIHRKRIDLKVRSSGLTFFDKVMKQKDGNIQPRCFCWHLILFSKTESPLIVFLFFCFLLVPSQNSIFFFIFKERVFSGPGLSIWPETFLTIPRLQRGIKLLPIVSGWVSCYIVITRLRLVNDYCWTGQFFRLEKCKIKYALPFNLDRVNCVLQIFNMSICMLKK